MAAMAQRIGQKLATTTPQFLNWSAGKGKIFLKYARVELRPPTINELPEASARMKKVINSAQTGKWKSVSVKEAWLNTLICIEVACWFFAGECIGKGRVIGYKIPGCFHDHSHDPGYKLIA